MSVSRPTESELEILGVLWKNGPNTVRFVNEQLERKGKNVGYTTTLKMMQIMTEKGMLERDISGRTHIYTPVIQASEIRSALIERLINSVFGGSATKMVLQALGNHQATTEELKEIRELIDKLEKNRKK
ncbi:MAG: BlaI/MecI/CopY family transcriptional regulator [Bacteroidales bacterium]|nr:BlaI/MecI/CopY family transcriptional regulator [Bacteroidales bacterium]